MWPVNAVSPLSRKAEGDSQTISLGHVNEGAQRVGSIEVASIAEKGHAGRLGNWHFA